jgi:hypothetical protein
MAEYCNAGLLGLAPTSLHGSSIRALPHLHSSWLRLRPARGEPMNRELVRFAFWGSIVDAAACGPLVWLWSVREAGKLTQQQQLGIALVDLSYSLLVVAVLFGLRELVRHVMNTRLYDKLFLVVGILLVGSTLVEVAAAQWPSVAELATVDSILSLVAFALQLSIYVVLRNRRSPFGEQWYWFCAACVMSGLTAMISSTAGVALNIATSIWAATLFRKALNLRVDT